MSGEDGLAAAIGLAMVCMIAGSIAVLGTIGWAITRKKKGAAGAIGGIALGALVGVAMVYFTFYQEDYPGAHAAPPRLDFEVPAGFAHDWVVLIEDPNAPTEIEWAEGEQVGFVTVPSSGVVRVRSMAGLEYPDARLLRRLFGGYLEGRDSRPPIAELGGSVWMFRFRPSNELTEPDLGGMSDDELVARVRALEGER